MTVKELIKELEQENQNAVVYLDKCGCYVEATGVDTLTCTGKDRVIIE